MQFHLLSFEGPDPYSRAGGLASRVEGLSTTLAAQGFETHLWFVGDPRLPGHESHGRLHLHRWCQWVSAHHPGGVYDGEWGKQPEYASSLPPYLLREILQPHLERGERAVVIAEEWQTVHAVLHLHWLLRWSGARERVALFWNANNVFGFERIPWVELSQAARITTVSRYMKQRMRELGVDALVIPNGLPADAFEAPDHDLARALCKRLAGRTVLTKMARWDPDKRWIPTLQIVAELKRRGWRPLLFARGGHEPYGGEVLRVAWEQGLHVVDRCVSRPGAETLVESLRGLGGADVVNLRAHVDPEARRLLFQGAEAVLANSGHEPFGLVGLETMAVGGLACTGCSGEDYAVPGQNALVLETGDAQEFIGLFQPLRSNPERSRVLRRNALDTARHYAWDEVVGSVLLPRVELTGAVPWMTERATRSASRSPPGPRVTLRLEEGAMAAPASLRRIGPAAYELGRDFRPGMRVPVRVFGSEKIVAEMDDQVFVQAANVATLPGIVEASFCMPDAHWGYGFPIGGVAAIDAETGVISPGGIGFDINCGMRLVRTDLSWAEVRPRLGELVDALAARVPAGVGSRGFVRVSTDEFREVLREGARWAVRRGYGTADDLARTEAQGCFPGADPETVSDRAVERGHRQLGTLGSGNHYLEIQVLHPRGVFDAELAQAFGLGPAEQVVVMFHCGSRGFGHQVATDYLQDFLRKMPKQWKLPVIDRELACAPFASEEGRAYFAAMCCAANMSFANRQVILHRIREVFAQVFRRDPDALGIRNVYDVAHNTAKLERHRVGGRERDLLVHRKGATRAFPPGHPDLPPEYRKTGQPVILGGSMETGSYVLAGVPSGVQTFFSTAHGSGRTMSRSRARKLVHGRELQDRMAARGILVRAASLPGLAEEAGLAYKSVDDVAEATEQAGLSRRVAHLVPVGNVKG